MAIADHVRAATRSPLHDAVREGDDARVSALLVGAAGKSLPLPPLPVGSHMKGGGWDRSDWGVLFLA